MASEWASERAKAECWLMDGGGDMYQVMGISALAAILDEAYEVGRDEEKERVIELSDDLLNASANLSLAQKTEREMQQIIARQRAEIASLKKHSACPYVVSSEEGTQFCRLNGTLEGVIEVIEKEIVG